MSAVSSTLEQTVAAGSDLPSDQHPNTSPLRRLLPELVRAMGWQRSERVLQSAITESGPLTIDGVVQALRRIGFVVRATQELPEEWRLGDDAALVRVSRSGEVEATVRRTGVTRRVDPDRPDDTSTSPRFRAAQFLLIVDAAASPLRHTDPTEAWSPALRRVVRGVFWLSFFINLLALSVPIFSMQIYDRVIGGGAPEVLPWFALGAVLSLVLMLVLRRQRSRLLAGVHSRLGYHLSLAVADRMLRLPLLVAGKLRRAALVSRLRELERMRDRFAAANTVAVFDAPFVLLTLVAVAFVGGWLVIIPAVYLIAFWLLANRVSSYVAAGARASGQASAERDAMLTDLADHGPALTASRSAPGWSRRFLEVSAEAVRGGYIQGTRLGLAQSLAYVLGTGTALATLVFGLELVLVGAMTPGGLIASMLLIWRITAPAQALFMSVGRLQQTEAAKEKVQRFFGAAYDGDDAGKRMPVPSEPQSLEFDRVSFRYSADQEAALAGVSFRIEPGEMLAVVGPNGAGKTTLLRLAAGLLEPQGGLVMMGGRNLKQFDPEEYRLSVGYYPEHPATFSGTLAQNLRAAVPGATDKELTAVMQLAWPANLSQYLVDGLDTKLPLSQSKGLALEDDQRLGLTQLIARSSPLLLISDPVENTGPDAPKHLKAFVEEAKALFRLWHGRRTIVLVSQNPELLAFADKALVLDKGQVIHFGPIQKPEAGEAGQTTGTAE